ncbi:histidine phosphatase family protein [Legionella oakridgensis]|uniref:Fructose-2,6-bisphosphatase n=2 Tax=Legionella oakridgensis TaxID=29423 RepID=W0BAR4_9GAMM|nr:phosphoglycerate mutase family protein [Legionella oakridgensis]AHE67638.1 fructose-2,6-bisphosphatase [Legionella oakridgensis ATCC 33761 = DSM 21215]ETO92873.1 fructose-2,6-bisphosphatase [Legionella oakridgensis RV-2-2007]KTD37020.1 putative phosphoserine phosphatase 2 [Legionella oakridgensis]STY20671.1 alpha-ribazole phosphatase [Legionella longbeachae]
MHLYIIRHLQTDWNKKGILQGTHDLNILPVAPEVTDLIQQQKKMLHEKVNSFDLVLTSSLRRTQETALEYGFSNFFVEPLINELNFGKFEGQPRELLIKELGQPWFDDPRELVLGESIHHFELRIRAFLEKYQHLEQLLIFSHGSWTRGVISFVRFGNLKMMNQVQVLNNQLIELIYQEHLVA